MIKLRIKHWMLAIIVFTIIIATYFSSQINNRNIGSTSQAIPLTLALVDESNSSSSDHPHQQSPQNSAQSAVHRKHKSQQSQQQSAGHVSSSPLGDTNSINDELEQSNSIKANNLQLKQVNANSNNNDISYNDQSQDVAIEDLLILTDADKTVDDLLNKGLSSSTTKISNTTTTAAPAAKTKSTSKTTTTTTTKKPTPVPKKDDGKKIVSNISKIGKSNNSQNRDLSRGYQTRDLYQSGFSELSSGLCLNQGSELRLMIIISSAPTHHRSRLAIRQTWGHYSIRRDVSIGFLIGATNNQATEDQLSAENWMYNDLIRGQFIDSYDNLTLKTISMLEWVDTVCPKVLFVLKTDDDMFINVPRLLAFIEKHHNDKRKIFGRLAKNWKPIRNTKSKYYVSTYQYFSTLFPQFTTGPAYLITSDIVHELYQESLNNTYLKLEDVYMTGIVPSKLEKKIHRVDANEFVNRRIAFNPCSVKKAISLHMIKNDEQYSLWKILSDADTKCKT